MPNTALLTKTLDYITTHPAEWDQIAWTTCFAGHACRLRGLYVESGLVLDRDGYECGHVEDIATQLLGISEPDAFVLFDSYNTLDDLDRIVARLVEEENVASSIGPTS